MKTLILFISLLSAQSFASTDCDGLCNTKLTGMPDQSFFQALNNMALFSAANGYPEMIAGDTRKVRSGSSPAWLEAVGTLTSTVSKGKKEQCSITLISDSPSKDGIIAITAGHCVDHWSNGERENFAAEENEVSFTSNNGKKINTSISEVLKFEMNPGDYAIVKLSNKISKSEIKPLINAPFKYEAMLDEEEFEGGYATMAGYSADKGLGQKGKVLTYDEKCPLNGGASGLKKGYCHSYRGASGGAVVVTVDLEDMPFNEELMDIGEQTYFVGSIKGGRNGDDNSKTMFTENSHYAKDINAILKAN